MCDTNERESETVMGGQQRPKLYEFHPYTVFFRQRLWFMRMNLTQLNHITGISMAQLSFLHNGNQDPSTISNPTHRTLSEALRVPMRTLLQLAGYELDHFSDEDLSELLEQARAAAEADPRFYLQEPNDVSMG